MKIMYYELIKMLIDYERRNHPETYDATKTVGDHIDFEFLICKKNCIKIIVKVGKIEGYQELTNKLQRYFFKKCLSLILLFFCVSLSPIPNTSFTCQVPQPKIHPRHRRSWEKAAEPHQHVFDQFRGSSQNRDTRAEFCQPRRAE